MLKQKQRWFHLEDGHCGDCYRTAIACYLDMVRDSVPHFVELHGGDNDWDDGTSVSDATRDWLKERGMSLIQVPLDGDITIEQVVDLGAHWLNVDRLMIGGHSVRGLDHMIVWDKEDGWWDPAKSQVGEGHSLTGPQKEGYWWILAIVPLWSEWKVSGDEQLFREGVLR